MQQIPYNKDTAAFYQLRDRAMLILHNGHMTQADIARLFGISATTVIHILDRMRRQALERKRFAFLGDDVPTRVREMLVSCNVTELIQLQAMSEAELLCCPNFGRKSMNWLKERGFWPAHKYHGAYRVTGE